MARGRTPREKGTNPRAKGTNPRAKGTNPLGSAKTQYQSRPDSRDFGPEDFRSPNTSPPEESE